MRFVNKDNVYLKISFDVFGDQRPFSDHEPTKSASPRPDLLEFAAGSDVSKHEI